MCTARGRRAAGVALWRLSEDLRTIRNGIGRGHDGSSPTWPYAHAMNTSYAVRWREPDGQAYVGRLELGPRALRLVGAAGGTQVDRQIGYDELQGLRIGHDAEERLDGRRALVIERPQGAYHLTSTVLEAGILQELVDRLSDLSLAAPRRATIVVPFKEGASARVRELAAAGPPFDPNETQLTRHQLLLTAQEAIFVFETADERGLHALLEEVDVWAAASAWHDLVAGPPRLAEVAYSWERPEPPRPSASTSKES